MTIAEARTVAPVVASNNECDPDYELLCDPDIPCAPDNCHPDCVPGHCNPGWFRRATQFLWLDLTRDCMLNCGHCYNESGPSGDSKLLPVLGPSASLMEPGEWFSVLDQAIRTGVGTVQLIGGEPTMYAGFSAVLSHALTIGLEVEIYTNLVSIRDDWWDQFQHPRVSLATSYYSDDPEEHHQITERDTHRQTRANIIKALGLKIPLRVGMVQKYPTQRVREARAELEALGVQPDRIRLDKVRAFGRGQGDHAACDVSELCGNCGNGRAAIGPDGTVTPCIMSEWLKAGNVKTEPLADILNGDAMAAAVATIPRRPVMGNDPCQPDCVPNNPCDPRDGGGACDPGTPPSECGPKGQK
jgi:MoaA/NifB/PqqE/SkfB family radical SAM enzyme